MISCDFFGEPIRESFRVDIVHIVEDGHDGNIINMKSLVIVTFKLYGCASLRVCKNRKTYK